MPSETDLLNDALGLIGASRITAIDDGTVNANHCQTFYPTLRDGLLAMVDWTFIKTRVELAQDAIPPVTQFAFAYTLPADCLKVIGYAGANPTATTWWWEWGMPWAGQWKIEAGKLLTNDGQAFILYLKREPNPDLWLAPFYQAVVHHVASKLAYAIAKDARMGQSLLQAGEFWLTQAMAVDGQQGLVEPYRADDLIWGRGRA